MQKYAISFTISTLSNKSQAEIVDAIYDLLSKFEKSEVIQHSIYTWLNDYTGKPLEFNEDGTLKQKKFEIGNITTDVL